VRDWLARVCLLLFLVLTRAAIAQPNDPEDSTPRYTPSPPVLYPGEVRNYRDVIFAEPRGFRPLTLDLYVPPEGGAPKPVVVFIHGGAWRSRTARDGGAIRDFPAVLASVAARNYVVASVNYRFSGEARFPAAVQDVALAIRWLRQNAARYDIDINRLVVWGSSAGGQIAALLGTACGVSTFEPPVPAGARPPLPSTCVQGVIDWYGLIDLEKDGTDLGKSDVPEYVNTYLGCTLPKVSPPTTLPATTARRTTAPSDSSPPVTNPCPAGWARSASPLPYINAKAPPFLIQHGAADITVSPTQSKRLYQALRAAGVPAELVIYPGVAHGFSKVTGGGPDDAVNKQAIDKVFEYLARYFPPGK
jgi:acetyl esterase/lipase